MRFAERVASIGCSSRIIEQKHGGICGVSSRVGLWHTRPVLSSVARLLALTAVCLACATSLARAQLIESPLDSEEASEEGLPFRGSTFGFSQSISGNSFFKSSQLSYNPSYDWGFALNLVWHFDRTFQLALNQELEVELTDSDTTASRQQVMLSDTMLTFDARLLNERVNPEFRWTVHGSSTLIAPTSLASQAATLVLGTRFGVAAAFTFPKALGGLTLSPSITYLHRWLQKNVPQVEQDFPCNAGAESRVLCTQTGGLTNTRLSLTARLGLEVALTEKWGLSAGYSHSWRRGADLADWTELRTADGAPVVLRDGDRNHWRNRSTIDLGVSYMVIPWLGLGLGLSNTFSELGPDGELRPPLKLADTAIGLDVLVMLDEVYLATQPSSSAD